MTELERLLLLQVHDTSWKDHLLVMDHLKSGVGLRGYAQLNPLIEFKKEGLASFERMMETTREKFTDLFFKARWVRQEALARIWAGQSTEHAEAASAYAAQQQAALDPSAGPDGPGRRDRQDHRPRQAQGRPQRPLPLRQRQEVQEVLRQERLIPGGSH